LTCHDTSSKQDALAVALVRALDVDHAGRLQELEAGLLDHLRCSGSMKLRRYSLMTLISISSHSFQQEEHDARGDLLL
jgi:hypothetical protein